MYSFRVHKRSKVEKERRKAEAEEKKKNAKYKPGAKKPSVKKSAVVTPSVKASTMEVKSVNTPATVKKTPEKDDLNKTLTMNTKNNLEEIGGASHITDTDFDETSRAGPGEAQLEKPDGEDNEIQPGQDEDVEQRDDKDDLDNQQMELKESTISLIKEADKEGEDGDAEELKRNQTPQFEKENEQFFQSTSDPVPELVVEPPEEDEDEPE